MADIELGIGHLHAHGGEAPEDGGEGGPRGGGPYDQVALETHAVDWRAGLLDDLDGLDNAVGFGAVVLEVIVVVVPFCFPSASYPR